MQSRCTFDWASGLMLTGFAIGKKSLKIHFYLQLSEEFLGKEETALMYERKAEEMENEGRFAEAEQVANSHFLENWRFFFSCTFPSVCQIGPFKCIELPTEMMMSSDSLRSIIPNMFRQV